MTSFKSIHAVRQPKLGKLLQNLHFSALEVIHFECKIDFYFIKNEQEQANFLNSLVWDPKRDFEDVK